MKYTAGELAKKLGVSARAIRWYDEKNLLTPCAYSKAGYRLYDDESAERLQKIIMLRYMDFSLEQICEMMREKDFDVRKSLCEQEALLQKKKEHIERVLEVEEQENDLMVPEEAVGNRKWEGLI
ncbi:MAG: MerR family transcriptional regulator [Roseburia sp.]|nr:MerR family transcriptional regulator [Roseburia sp.]